MFYNSKKLIDEKVLQQYFFEKFMLADSSQRQSLLPKKYQKKYSKTSSIKGLHPEVSIGQTSKKTKHVTDFILYPSVKSSLSKLNIEIKWNVKDFTKQNERFDFYNGTKGEGYVVAMEDENNHSFVIDKSGKKTKIPVVYLEKDDFKSWFSKNSYNIVSQSLSVKLNIQPNRITGPKYWVINLGKEALSNYFNNGQKNGIWAFKDKTNPKNIMQILENDYVVFVNVSCNPGRMIFPEYRNKKYQPGADSNVESGNIKWHLNFVDIFKITRGYHLDFTNNKAYGGFEGRGLWNNSINKLPEEKDYTQFIRFEFDKNDQLQFKWNKSKNFKIKRALFKENNDNLVEFVDAVRISFCTSGDANQISKVSFESLVQLISTI